MLFTDAGDPVISVDTKKKELVGNFAANGREYEPTGAPRKVLVHDFADKDLGKVAPYGVYDITANTGWVNVGTDAGQFAVESIRRWWNTMGAGSYPGATKLLITADAGGSNGSRLRLWKTELAEFAAQSGLAITVCHLPPGTSKWNKIEHRLFSAISRNWRGRPLESHEVIIQTLNAVTTRTGLTVHAELDTNTYQRGIKIPAKGITALPGRRHPTRHEFHGDWNYTMHPRDTPEGTHLKYAQDLSSVGSVPDRAEWISEESAQPQDCPDSSSVCLRSSSTRRRAAVRALRMCRLAAARAFRSFPSVNAARIAACSTRERCRRPGITRVVSIPASIMSCSTPSVCRRNRLPAAITTCV